MLIFPSLGVKEDLWSDDLQPVIPELCPIVTFKLLVWGPDLIFFLINQATNRLITTDLAVPLKCSLDLLPIWSDPDASALPEKVRWDLAHTN